MHEYGENICPNQEDISYVDGKVRCSVHLKDGEVEGSDDEDGNVPFL